ncbi:MAG: hypothetical protein ACI4R8_00385 [Candidatus Caccovivens sp.]
MDKITEILETIKTDLESKNYFNADMSDIISVHFGVCLYIRNKYLWRNSDVVEMLNAYFKTNNVDDLSHKILNEIKKEDSQSSNPNK